jgi:type IV pilus assembly protein PilO
MEKIDFEELEISEIGSWPKVLRIAVLSGICLLSLGLGYFFILSGDMDLLIAQKTHEENSRKDFKDKYYIAENLDAYEKQMLDIVEAYEDMLHQLPLSDQLPELLESISRLAQNNGLKYQSIKPGDPVSAQGFYKELPLDLTLTGNYNGFGGFVSDVAKVQRIVTMHDFDIKPIDDTKTSKANGSLTMNIKLKTYWLSAESENKDTTTKGADNKALMPGGALMGPGQNGPGSINKMPGGPAGKKTRGGLEQNSSPLPKGGA